MRVVEEVQDWEWEWGRGRRGVGRVGVEEEGDGGEWDMSRSTCRITSWV